MRRLIPLTVLLLGFCGLLAALLWQLAGSPPEPAKNRLSLPATLGGEAAAGYARALIPRPFLFPRDHGPHPDFRTEWWYFTGNLEDATGRHFGYQLTFFRIAMAPRAPQRASAWATRQVYMAHFALTDAAGKKFHNFERFSRAAVGLAGAAGRALPGLAGGLDRRRWRGGDFPPAPARRGRRGSHRVDAGRRKAGSPPGG